jgi:hypothetical protein
VSSVQIGNAGEHYVMACLLAQGIHAGLADRGNPHFDILVRNKSGDFRAVRVKTTRGASFQWTAKEEWDPLPGFDKDNPDPQDISVLVAFNDKPPGRDTELYVIPTARLVEDINRVNRHYHNHKNRNGSERKRSPQRVIRLDGLKKPDNIAYGFRDEWRLFRDCWKLLDGAAAK